MSEALGLDEREHAKALIAALEAASTRNAYEYGDVPGLDGNEGDEPAIYWLVQVERRNLPPLNMVKVARRTGWRASIRSVGTTINECRWAVLHASERLDSKTLTIGSLTSSRLQHETGESPEFDDGRADALTRYTYAL